MLEVSARHAFGGFTLDVAFAAPPGVTALFGPSGSGKSTILSVVAGLLRPQAGRVALDGLVLLDTVRRISVPAERRRCGVVFQDARLLPHLSVETNLRYGARRAPREATGPGFEEVVALLGIGDLLTRRPRGLSGGEQQRVALGRALLSRPRLLLMDEPLAALDGPRRAEILPFLERLRDVSSLPILYVTHALDEVDRLADTLVLIEAGRVQAAGPVPALMSRTGLPLLSGRRDAGALLSCVVQSHDRVRGLTTLAFDGGTLLVPLRQEAAGARLRLRLRARDVALATEAPRGISTHNVLPGVVTAIEAAGPHETIVTITVGPSLLLARLTRDAVSRLGLAPGAPVFGLVKSTAFDHG
jgi:molybdate transport system ATP-binding protein